MEIQDIKIGMTSAYFATMKGGGEHYTLHLSNKLADLGHDITIICGKQPFRKPEPLSNRFKIEYVPQLYFLRDWGMKGITRISGGAWYVHSYQYTFSCYRHLLNEHDFDVIHTHDPASLNAAIRIKRKYHIPIVSTFHGHPSLRNIEEAKNVDAILPVSKEIKFSFEEYGIKNVYDMPGGVDLSHFKLLNREQCKDALGLNGKIILFVGRLIPIKNLHNLLYAFKKVQSVAKDTKLLIVGDGALKGNLVSTVQRLGLNENIIFAGAVSYKKLPTYYNASDVFVLPSIFESFPLVALEAAACGIPLVISTLAKAFVEDFGKDFIFSVDPNNINSISSGLIQALSNDRANETAKLVEKRIKKYDWIERAKKVAGIYKMVIENEI